MFCAYCGAETQIGDDSCRHCGRVLVDRTSSNAANTVLAAAPASPKVPRVSKPGVGDDTPTLAVGTLNDLSDVQHTRLPSGGSSPSSGAENGRSALLPGQAFGARYTIIRLLGAGGMGAVYQAWDAELGVSVALKIIRPDATTGAEDAASLAQRFKRELLLAREVTHRNVVRIYDLGDVDGTKYISMSYVDGDDLSSILAQRGKLPVKEALALARQIAAGLQAAHEADVVHRDLKPANIMIERDGLALIMDFGLARQGSANGADVDGGNKGRSVPAAIAAAGHTTLGTVLGTAHYMAPEQAKGQPVDHRADIYAFGLILRDMLLGLRPTTDNPLADLFDRAEHGLPRPRSVDATIPDPIDKLVDRCMALDPAARYGSMSEVCAELARLDEDGNPLPEPRRLTWRLLAALVAVSALVVVGAIWLLRPSPPPAAHEPVSVIIADFENRSGDKVFEGGLEQALSIAIEGASFITAYSRTEATRIVERNHPGGTLTAANARLVARSEGIHVVLAGSIAREGSQYRISLQIVDPAGQVTARTVETSVNTKADVLKAMGLLAGKVRAALGDTEKASAMQAAAETFTTVSLDAMREYAVGQDLLLSRKEAEAIDHFRRAVQYDPQFGRAYAGLGTASFTLGRADDSAQQWKKAMQFIEGMTEREKYRTLGGYFLTVSRDYDKAIEKFEALVKRYPADTAGQNNLAYAYFQKLDFSRALEEGRRAVALQKNSPMIRQNYMLYAMYAGQFQEAAKAAETLRKDAPALYLAYLPLAVANVAAGNLAAARDAYRQMAAVGELGASTSALGLADLALYEGKGAEARAILVKGIADDQRVGNTVALVSKYAALADAAILENDRRGALAAADAMVKLGGFEESAVPASRAYLTYGAEAAAARLAAQLLNQVTPKTQAYGKIIEGQIALRQGRTNDAIAAFLAAQKLADVWLARYNLAVTYVQKDKYGEAFADLDLCAGRRRGEATALFLDDLPTLRYLSPLLYWQARVTEGLKGRDAAADPFRKFLALRQGSKDPLALDARARLAQ